jgi:hypothetical protein
MPHRRLVSGSWYSCSASQPRTYRSGSKVSQKGPSSRPDQLSDGGG